MESKKISTIILHLIIIILGIVYIWTTIDSTPQFRLLVTAMIIDIYTGILKAINDETLSVKISFKGMTKKASILGVVALSFIVERAADTATNYDLPISSLIMIFFIATEGLSILENAASSGMPFPKRLYDILEKMKGDTNV